MDRRSAMATIDMTQTGSARDGAGRLPRRQGRFAAALRDLTAGFPLYDLWLFLGWRDLRNHYSRSVLGPLWLTAAMGVEAVLRLAGALLLEQNDEWAVQPAGSWRWNPSPLSATILSSPCQMWRADKPGPAGRKQR
jgi:hypothetical protein